jgi:hypothetical protein
MARTFKSAREFVNYAAGRHDHSGTKQWLVWTVGPRGNSYHGVIVARTASEAIANAKGRESQSDEAWHAQQLTGDIEARWGVWCQVWGGVTGHREAWMKRGDGIATFDTKEAAEAEAAAMRANVSRYSNASFNYTARAIG